MLTVKNFSQNFYEIYFAYEIYFVILSHILS